jgi:hypothetical protein
MFIMTESVSLQILFLHGQMDGVVYLGSDVWKSTVYFSSRVSSCRGRLYKSTATKVYFLHQHGGLWEDFNSSFTLLLQAPHSPLINGAKNC